MSGPADVVRRMREAFNARDRDGFLELLTEDVEFRNPMGKTMRGPEAASTFWESNVKEGVFVEQDGAERVDGPQVAVPTIVRMADGTELRSAAVFDVRDGKIAQFHLVMNRAAVGL